MVSVVAVIACALTALGRGPATLPRILLVDTAPAHASAHVEAFVPMDGDTIFIMTTSATLNAIRDSRCQDRDAVRKLASVIVHEEWHLLHGPDEKGAYEAQLATLVRLGAMPGSRVHYAVIRSMRAAGRKQH